MFTQINYLKNRIENNSIKKVYKEMKNKKIFNNKIYN